MSKPIRQQTINEEWFNSLSHGITAFSAIGGFVVLILFGIRSQKEWSLFSALFYGGSLVGLYTFSTLYHGLIHQKAKHIFNILDHCGIFILIAGTYTPILLISIGGTTGWIFFSIQWGMALVGVILKIFYTGKFRIFSTIIYAVMGWIIVFKVNLLTELLPPPAYWLLFSGGLAYTVGILFYIMDSRIKYAHFIWHLFVMAGSILHYLMMVMYVFR